LSYHITEAEREEIGWVRKLREGLQEYFVVIDPYTIEDWTIVDEYDNALKNGSSEIIVSGVRLNLSEVERAIDIIREQIVERDYYLIENVHGIVVAHIKPDPSYGVMCEIIHAKSLGKPIRVFYPHAKRPSPFFEFYVETENIYKYDGGVTEEAIHSFIKHVYEGIDRWPTWKAS